MKMSLLNKLAIGFAALYSSVAGSGCQTTPVVEFEKDGTFISRDWDHRQYVFDQRDENGMGTVLYIGDRKFDGKIEPDDQDWAQIHSYNEGKRISITDLMGRNVPDLTDALEARISAANESWKADYLAVIEENKE